MSKTKPKDAPSPAELLEHDINGEVYEIAAKIYHRMVDLRLRYDKWVSTNNASLEKQAVVFGATRRLKDALADILAVVNEMHTKQANTDLPAAFNAFGDTTSIANSYGTIYMTQRKTASVQDREKAMEWLRAVGLGDLIQPSVNAATLSSALKDFDHEPDPEVIKISLHTLAAIRGKTKKD